MKFANYSNIDSKTGKKRTEIRLTFTNDEAQAIFQKYRNTKFLLSHEGSDTYILIVDNDAGCEMKQAKATGGWYLVYGYNRLPPTMKALPQTGAVLVESEMTGRGIRFLWSKDLAVPSRGSHKKEQMPSAAKVDEPEADAMKDFKLAVGTVNRLRRKCHAELSVSNGALFATVSITRKIKIS